MELPNLNFVGSEDAEMVVVCDVPSLRVWQEGKIMSKAAMKVVSEAVRGNGMEGREFCFLTCAPPLPDTAVTDGQIGKFIDQYREELYGALQQLQNKKVVIYFGKNAGRVVEGKNVKITQITGRVREINGLDCHVFPMLSPAMVLRRPEVREQFMAEFAHIPALREHDWDAESLSESKTEGKYEWVTDLQSVIDELPSVIAVDTETDGLHKGNLPLVTQLSYEEGKAVIVPTDRRYYEKWKDEFEEMGIVLEDDYWPMIKEQLGEVLGTCPVVGHNFKFDYKTLRSYGIEKINWYVDTMQMAFAADDNMQMKNLAACVKRWVPEMAGYSDHFDSVIDKNRMMDVSPLDMTNYAGGDAEVTLILAKRLSKIVKQDPRNWDAFFHVQMPALKMFALMEETGLLMDKEELKNLQAELEKEEIKQYKSLIRQVSNKVKERHKADGLKFTRDAFVRDILFSKKSEGGMGITPVVFTDSTKKLSPDQRKPSISVKDHLSYFESIPFVQELIQYSKLQKMRSTYVGKDSVWEPKRVKLLKDGGLPKKVSETIGKAGITWTPEEGLRKEGCRIRARQREITFEGRKVQLRLTTGISDDKRLAVDKKDNLWIEEKTKPTGFWQYLQDTDLLYPNYHLDKTVTGRTSSSDPNAQNMPKRGKLAKAYRKVFIAPEGYTLIGCDLSQAELRIAAWMANERNMIRIYKEGGDIHATTAAAVMGIEMDRFDAWKGSDDTVESRMKAGGFEGDTYGELFDYRRFQAKAVNFGFIYGQSAYGFRIYAKTQYGIDLTEEESIKMRNTFFALYPGLEKWHGAMKEFVHENGYVRALHGALRRLSAIYSDDDGVKASAERQAINSPVQRFASDLGLMGLNDFFSEGVPLDDVLPQAFIHDAGYIIARDEVAYDMAAGLKWCMENQMINEIFGITSPIPIAADVELGKNLAELEEIKLDAKMPYWLEETTYED